MQKLFEYLLQLAKKNWTGKLSLYFHEGYLQKIKEENTVDGIVDRKQTEVVSMQKM